MMWEWGIIPNDHMITHQGVWGGYMYSIFVCYFLMTQEQTWTQKKLDVYSYICYIMHFQEGTAIFVEHLLKSPLDIFYNVQ